MPGACLGSIFAGNGVVDGLRVVYAELLLLLLLLEPEFGAAGAVSGRSEARAGWVFGTDTGGEVHVVAASF